MLIDVSPGIKALFDPLNRRAWGGLGRLGGALPAGDEDGRAKIMNVPARVQITVMEALSDVVVARTVSRENGTWEVSYLDPTRLFTVIGRDYTRTVNSAIQDWVQPHPMEP